LSLASIPPLAGFFGKFAVFAAALQLGGLAGPAGWLTFLAIALSAVALYYYLIVLKQALVTPPAPNASPIAVPAVAKFTLVVAAELIVLFGVCPSARVAGCRKVRFPIFQARVKSAESALEIATDRRCGVTP
jgi:NADH-quinone oxidoreductase subunit N